jgi:HEAT repeat protein
MNSAKPPRKEPAKVGLAKTLGLLAKTPNEAAIGLLIPALDSPDQAIQEGVLRAILDRRSPTGQREVLKRLHAAPERWRQIIDERRGRMTHALRDAVLGSDMQMCRNGCQSLLWFHEYDLVPALITAAEDETHPNADLATATLVELADLLYSELAGPRNYSDRRDPQIVRRHFTGSLEASLLRYVKHSRRELVGAFLVLAARENAVLKQVLQDPHHAAYLPLLDELLHNQRSGVLRLLLSFLDDSHAPSAAISVLARRSDLKFVQHLLRKIGYEPSTAAAQNLRRVDHIAWLRHDGGMIDDLEDSEQHSLVQMVMATGINRLEVFKTIEHLVRHGKPAGRRAASQALAAFNGAEANGLALRALSDVDPLVQAAILPQLRQRGIPGALTRLIDFVDSPYPVVQQSARDSLGEFSFDRFLAAFDMLDEEVRHSTGVLVRKVNPEAGSALAEEMRSRSRTRRLRAVAVTIAMRLADELEAVLIELLTDEDHVIRTEAVRALGFANSPSGRQALHEALSDRSVSVQETAERSLRQIDSREAAHRHLQEQQS